MSVNDGIRGAHGKGEVFLPLNALKPPNGGHRNSREGWRPAAEHERPRKPFGTRTVGWVVNHGIHLKERKTAWERWNAEGRGEATPRRRSESAGAAVPFLLGFHRH